MMTNKKRQLNRLANRRMHATTTFPNSRGRMSHAEEQLDSKYTSGESNSIISNKHCMRNKLASI